MTNNKEAYPEIIEIPMYKNESMAKDDAPRYVYHQVRGGYKGGDVMAYTIRETEAASNFGKGYENNKYVWLSQTPFGDGYVKIDLSKVDPYNLRYTGQVEGHLLHKGNIPASAVIGLAKNYILHPIPPIVRVKPPQQVRKRHSAPGIKIS
jgi:hypothetical protein